MKIAPICLLTACKRRKLKLFGDSSQIRAIGNGITCCYWSASLSNRLRALKAHSSSLKCCAKNCPNYMYRIQGKHRGSWVWVFLRLSVSLKLIFVVPFDFYSISIFFNSRGRVPLAGNSLRAEKSHWQVQKVTLAGPKVTQGPKCHIGVLYYLSMQGFKFVYFSKRGLWCVLLWCVTSPFICISARVTCLVLGKSYNWEYG